MIEESLADETDKNVHVEFSSLSSPLGFYVKTGGLDIVWTFCIPDAAVHHQAFLVTVPCAVIQKETPGTHAE